MLVGAIALPVAFVADVRGAGGPRARGIRHLGVRRVPATATAFSLFQVPYIALPAELTADYDARTRLLTWRVVVLTLAILLFGAGGPMLRRACGDDETLGYLVMAIVAGLVIGAGMFVADVHRAARGPVRPNRAATHIRAGYAEGIARAAAQPRRSAPCSPPSCCRGSRRESCSRARSTSRPGCSTRRTRVTFLFVALIAPAVLLRAALGRARAPHRQGARVRDREHRSSPSPRRASSACSGRPGRGCTARSRSRAPPTPACSRCRWRCCPT